MAARDSMAGLHQIEADIQLCERFLNMDARDSQEGSNTVSAGPQPGSSASGGGGGGGGSGANMSQQRRKEILDRLLAERSAGKKASGGGVAHSFNKGPAKTLSGGGWGGTWDSESQGSRADGGGSGNSGTETREELIQRLIAEKRERESRRQQGDSAGNSARGSRDSRDGDTHALESPTRRDRAVRQAWGNTHQSVGRSSPDTDSLDSEALKSGKSRQYHTDLQSAAAQRRPASARPASAPRQRMTSGGRLVGGQDSLDMESGYREVGGRDIHSRPQSARDTRSVSKERPSTTRPKSPNLSKAPNMHSKERITRQMELEMREQLTFKPKISQYKYTDGEPKVLGERVEYLARSKKAIWEARERAKIQREEEEQRRQCSFKPKVTGARTGASPSAVPVEVRLLNTASNKQVPCNASIILCIG